ncbi:MAG: lipopolysaccharide biosynthesis protein [Anaerolineae bacterium]|nr:lipopolysaccharide biosynthesis protein [Anaerolineae bacterium]
MESVIYRIKTFLNPGTFARNVAVLVSGTALGQAITVLASPILTRIYSPEDFGLLSVFVSLFSMLVIMNSLRYEVAIPLAEDDEGAINIVALVVVLVIMTTTIFGVLFWLWGDWIFSWINAPELKAYVWLLLLSLLGGGFYQAFSFWCIRRETFRTIASSKLWQGAGMVAVQLGLGVITQQTAGLLAGIAGGQVISNWPLLRFARREDKHLLKHIHFSGMKKVASRYRRFPLWTSWSSFLNTAGLQMPAILIVSIYGAETGGWFSLSQRIIGLPTALIGVSIGQVYVSRAARLIHENPQALQSLFIRTAWRLLILGILPIGFLALTGPWLFALVFGEEWRTTGQYVQIMAPFYLVHFVVSSLGQNIYVIERQDIQSVWDVLRLGLLLGVFWFGSTNSLDATTTIGLYTIVMLLAYLVLFFLNIYALRQYKKQKLSELS